LADHFLRVDEHMHVEWVHPSWRDLVIDHLSGDDSARERFLRSCSVHGVMLAISVAGGAAGERRLPLLRRDADWDALDDHAHELVAALADNELLAMLDALSAALDGMADTPAVPELEALAVEVLARAARLWDASRSPIPLPLLAGWIAVAEQCLQRPALPSVTATWTELLPVESPGLDEAVALDRFADWLLLAKLLQGYVPGQLQRLHFERSEALIDCFVQAVAGGVWDEATVEQVERALRLAARLRGPYSESARRLQYVVSAEGELDAPAPEPEVSYDVPPERSGVLDVRRVLADL
jgi:hypothetical protein